MRALSVFFCVLVCAAMLPVRASGVAGAAGAAPVSLASGPPAGILLYAQEADGSIWLLLADHMPPSQRGWAAFGGSHDAGETLAETAARETEEETGGYFKRADLLRAIEGQEPVFDGVYGFYFVKVDKVPVEQIEASAAAVVAAAAAAGDAGSAVAYAERGPFVWIPYAQAERWLDTTHQPDGKPVSRYSRMFVIDTEWLPAAALPSVESMPADTAASQPSPTNWLWAVWLNNLRAARAAGAIPWQQPSPVVIPTTGAMLAAEAVAHE